MEQEWSMGPCDPPLSLGVLLHLPEEIILNIISRLPVESVLHCRRVCKTWRNLPLIRHINNFFADMHLCRLLQNDSNSDIELISFVYLDSSQRFLIYVEYDDENDVESFNKQYRFKMPLPPGTKSLVGTCNGLICSSVEVEDSACYDPVYICNPITREFLHLPRFVVMDDDDKHKNNRTIATGFGYHPSTKEYKVVRMICYHIDDEQTSIGQVQVYTLGSGMGWRNKGETSHRLLLPTINASQGVLLNGAIHWLSTEGNILVFDLADEEFHCLPTPPCSSPYGGRKSMIYVVGGWLCLVCQKDGQFADIWLLKKKNEEKQGTRSDYDDMKEHEYQSWSWSREFTIESHHFYITHQPFAITKSGEILLWDNEAIIVCFDRNATLTSNDVRIYESGSDAMSYFKSFVSLKALGENAEILG